MDVADVRPADRGDPLERGRRDALYGERARGAPLNLALDGERSPAAVDRLHDVAFVC
jgi:hypothetical protein